MIETRIRTAYHQLNQVGWVGLTDLRAALADLDQTEVDATLRDMSRARTAVLAPGANQKALSQADRDAAVTIGVTRCHMVSIV